MIRRELIKLLCGAAAASLPQAVFAQDKKRPLIGALFGGSEVSSQSNIGGFLQGMQELGYVQGRDFDIIARFAGGDTSRQPDLATELVGLRPDLIVTGNTGATVAVKQRSQIPIVSPALDDPVGLGLIESYARPGGQVTGIVFTIETLPGKQLQLALEVLPSAARAGVLLNPAAATWSFYRKAAESAAANLKVGLVPFEVRSVEELEAAFVNLARDRVDVLLVLPNPLFSTEGPRIARLAASLKLPTLSAYRPFPAQGGLLSYGIDLRDNHRRIAVFVDKILKGAKPADLPVELPTKFEMAINLSTAKALSLTVPTSILLRADEVVE
jgi:putative ABC transport system substrate-binding protein